MIAGTTIGAGMLALPLKTAAAGFLPSIALFSVCFLFMLYTVFLLLESTLMSPQEDANFISMTGQRLGKMGQLTAWVFFLLLLYSVSAAYMSAGGSLITALLRDQLTPDLPMYVGMWIFAVIFGATVYFGTRMVDHINKFLIIGLSLSFVLLISGMVPSMHLSYVTSGHPSYLWMAVPIAILSFTSHVIVPSIRTYLKSDIKQLKRALVCGMLVPLVFYVCWEFLILSLVPSEGPYGMIAIAQGPHPVSALTDTLEDNLGLPFIAAAVGAFSFCALVTSFLAVNLSLKDFLADGLPLPSTKMSHISICLLTVLPPLAYALIFPKGFTFALGYAGVFVAVLYGILPALMVYKGRYVQKLKAPYRTPGGKFGLGFVLVGAIFVIVMQVLATLGYLPS